MHERLQSFRGKLRLQGAIVRTYPVGARFEECCIHVLSDLGP